MSRFLYGEVLTKVITIEADDEAGALAILNASQKAGLHGKKFDDPNFKKDVYGLKWGETPDSDIAGTRNGVLSEFLHLMNNVIAFPTGHIQLELPPPSNIITPPGFEREQR